MVLYRLLSSRRRRRRTKPQHSAFVRVAVGLLTYELRSAENSPRSSSLRSRSTVSLTRRCLITSGLFDCTTLWLFYLMLLIRYSPIDEVNPIAPQIYDPLFVDDPGLTTGKHRTVMNLPSFKASIIPFVKASDLKSELNKQFRYDALRLSFYRKANAIT